MKQARSQQHTRPRQLRQKTGLHEQTPMLLILQATQANLSILYPLQLQNPDMFVVVLVGVVLVAGIIVALLFAFRRTQAMSDQLSKEAETRLKALRPQIVASPSSKEPANEIKRSQFKGERPEPAGINLNANVELNEIKRRLDQLALTMTSLRENVALVRKDVEETKAKMHTLEARTNMTTQDLQSLRTGFRQLSGKLLDYSRDIARHREEYSALSALVKSVQQEAYSKPQPVSAPVAQPPTTDEQTRSNLHSSQVTNKPSIFSGIFSRNRRACANCGRRLNANDLFCDSCGMPTHLHQQNV